ncbi:MAG TPA: hypothetical protein VLY85_01205 [Thermoplasmata archaeon]|nr:hypothetical protein [Thermoplasmata archaeon]
MSDDPRPLVVPLPRRLDRRMRLGPFPSAREAMKFAAYAAVGTIALPVGGALAWVPFLSAGFLFAVYRPNGKGIDERAADYLRWQFRRRRTAPSGGPSVRPVSPESVLRLPGPFLVAIVEAGGIPVRYLPPSDARELFDRYRELLRSSGGGFHLVAGTVPLGAAGFRPREAPGSRPSESRARDGYRELVTLLAQRRRRRLVRFLVFEPLNSPASLRTVEERARLASASLDAMGAEPRRVTGEALRRAAAEIGWPIGRVP